ncbi:MAG TPA: prepilin-type N-terminal cleavage/methylation domain-containing protein [Candidatus Acidoferrales bacterium]|nr:prepilin-type N-terminal cleavage/methylation domain-containing protein [Candidatus Acidoferrales bacterium]
MIAERGKNREIGFSLIEIMTVLLVMGILVSIAILKMEPTLQEYQSNAALDQVKGTLRQARELAISRRRCVYVNFANDVQGLMAIQLSQAPTSCTAPVGGPFLSIPIETTVQVITFGGEVDTPDGFGIPPAASVGVEFGGVVGAGGVFQTDGSFTNAAGGTVNGTVFLTPNNLATTNLLNGVRAVTIMGSTGRIRSYHYAGTGWRQVE